MLLETRQTKSQPNCYGQSLFQTLHLWLSSGHASGRQPHQMGGRRPWLSHWAVFAFPALLQLYAGWRHTRHRTATKIAPEKRTKTTRNTATKAARKTGITMTTQTLVPATTPLSWIKPLSWGPKMRSEKFLLRRCVEISVTRAHSMWKRRHQLQKYQQWSKTGWDVRWNGESRSDRQRPESWTRDQMALDNVPCSLGNAGKKKIRWHWIHCPISNFPL